MRLRYELLLVCLLGCEGDPVGEADVDAGKGGSSNGGADGSAASSASGGIGGSGGSSGSGASGGSAGGGAGIGGASASGGTGGVLVPGPEAAQGLDVDATHVYFGIGKDVWRAPKDGGAKTLVSSGATNVREVVVSAGYVYFLEGSRTIRRSPITGASAQLVVQGSGAFEEYGDIATDGTYVYFTTTTDKIDFDGAVQRVAVAGGVPFEIHKVINAGDPHGIALFGGEVFWTQHQNGMLYKAPIAGGGATLLATGLAQPWKVAPNAELVYWTETLGSLAYKKYGSLEIAVSSSGPGDDVVIDDNNVYFSAPSAGKVYGAPLDSTSAVVIAECALAGALALDTSSLFVACGGDPGAVLKVTK